MANVSLLDMMLLLLTVLFVGLPYEESVGFFKVGKAAEFGVCIVGSSESGWQVDACIEGLRSIADAFCIAAEELRRLGTPPANRL
jgi:hypothetical protein